MSPAYYLVSALEPRPNIHSHPRPSAKPKWVLPPTDPKSGSATAPTAPTELHVNTALHCLIPYLQRAAQQHQNVILQVSPSHFPPKKPHTNIRISRDFPFVWKPGSLSTIRESRVKIKAGGAERGNRENETSGQRRPGKSMCVCV